MVVYVEKPKESTKKLLELLREYNTATEQYTKINHIVINDQWTYENQNLKHNATCSHYKVNEILRFKNVPLGKIFGDDCNWLILGYMSISESISMAT